MAGSRFFVCVVPKTAFRRHLFRAIKMRQKHPGRYHLSSSSQEDKVIVAAINLPFFSSCCSQQAIRRYLSTSLSIYTIDKLPIKQQQQSMKRMNIINRLLLQALVAATTLAAASAFVLSPSSSSITARSRSTSGSTSGTTALPLSSVSIPLPHDEDYGRSTTATTTASSSSIVRKSRTPSPVSPGSAAFPKVGVLLLNLGGPETLDDVEGTYVVVFDFAWQLSLFF